MIRLKGPTSVEMMQVIKVTAKKGLGIEGDPTYLCDLIKWESDRAKKIVEEYSRKIGKDINPDIKDSATKIDGKALYQAVQDK